MIFKIPLQYLLFNFQTEREFSELLTLISTETKLLFKGNLKTQKILAEKVLRAAVNIQESLCKSLS